MENELEVVNIRLGIQEQQVWYQQFLLVLLSVS